MPDFLTQRSGSWHFVRRVPTEFAQFDPRGIFKHTTKVRVADDKRGLNTRPRGAKAKTDLF